MKKLYDRIKSEMSDHLLMHTAMLQNLEPESRRYLPGLLNDAPSRDYLVRVISIADEVIGRVDETALLAFLGTKTDLANEVSQKTKRYILEFILFKIILSKLK